MFEWVLNTPLDGFVQNAPRKELAITISNKLAVSSTTDILLKNQIFVDVFEIEDHEYTALRKEHCSIHSAL